MVGVIPAGSKTYEIFGSFDSVDCIEGKLYYDDAGRLFYYSDTEQRPSPKTGFFPVWNGKDTFTSRYSNNKFISDAIILDLTEISNSLTDQVASDIQEQQDKAENKELQPVIGDEDNFFTQCIKSAINILNLGMIDLIQMSNGKLTERQIENYYNSLVKIPFMRPGKWNIWIDTILHLQYDIKVYRSDGTTIVTYNYPADSYDTGDKRCNTIVKCKNYDFLKKLIRIIILKENLDKHALKDNRVQSHTINNLMTAVYGDKTISAQLFSRFCHMANITYTITLYQEGAKLFEYKE